MKLIWDLQTDGPPAEAVFPDAAVDSPLDAINPPFMVEDDMAAWLNCPVIEAQGGATQDQPPVEGSDLTPLAAATAGKRAMALGSEKEESEVLMLGQSSQRPMPYSSVSAERKRKKVSKVSQSPFFYILPLPRPCLFL